MKHKRNAAWLRLTGYALCTLPPLAASLYYFPLWFSGRDSRQVISAGGLILLVLCLMPFAKGIAGFFHTPSMWKLWCVTLLAFGMLNEISRGLYAISAVALPFSLAGALCFSLAKGQLKKDKESRDNE